MAKAKSIAFSNDNYKSSWLKSFLQEISNYTEFPHLKKLKGVGN
jgi:hypothetical protein